MVPVGRFAVVAIVAVGLLVGSGGPVDAGFSSLILQMKVARPSGQFGLAARVNLAEGQAKTLEIKVRTVDGLPEDTLLRHGGATPLYKLKYFRNGLQITDEVFSPDGYSFVAKPKAKFFQLKIKRLAGAVAATCFTPLAEDTASAFAEVDIAINQSVSNCP